MIQTLPSPCRFNKEYANYIQRRDPPKMYSWYNTKLNLMVRLLFKESRKCGVPLPYHYTKVHSDFEW